MVLYEEKVISPLAVRFCQWHISTTFRDGREVERSFEQIEISPGKGEYDYLLIAPFPNIEIVRCDANGRLADDEEANHWFTLDNRRLYCLQKKAMEMWKTGKTVGVVVDILRSAHGSSIKRKFDTETGGRTVSIAPHLHDKEVTHWDWREGTSGGGSATRHAKLLAAIEADDRKADWDKLLTAEDSASDSVSRLTAYLNVGPLLQQQTPTKVNPTAPCSGTGTPSTEAAASDADSDVCSSPSDIGTSALKASVPAPSVPPGRWRRASSPNQAAPADAEAATDPMRALVERALVGAVWVGGKQETYKVRITAPKAWTVVREDAVGQKTYPLIYDEDQGLVYWGAKKAYVLDAAKLSEHPHDLRWFAAGALPEEGDSEAAASCRPRFVWRRQDGAQLQYTMGWKWSSWQHGPAASRNRSARAPYRY